LRIEGGGSVRTLPAGAPSTSVSETEASVTAMAELFSHDAVPSRGADVVDPIDLEGEGAGAEADDIDDHVSCPSTSDVWNDFKKLLKLGLKGKEIRYGAICIHYKIGISVLREKRK